MMLRKLGIHFTSVPQICKCVKDDTKLVGWQLLGLVIPAVDSPGHFCVSLQTVEDIDKSLTSW